ncbi:MAG: hypothetical protein J0I33_07800 [Microbacterium ginsengisoli]|jgi:hypothetical protein|uniref:hypothetical protein n=2 Tax=Microbacteriaceae TaxID=85023 RepID=UPI000700A6B8|nr:MULTISPECIES: hypothetical protein [unclassified Microbacterium]KQR97700.1 hypothetical protein ASF93_13305 [Microbacterium sp. Leaf347]MBN9198527.1 hypothetical protein [Microbacterium ginsengisoli]OJU78089.1 MAG: hypothetical protein BGO15_02495 [Microbacterium sp. 71-23]
MGKGYASPPQGEYGELERILSDVQTRLKELETPTGTSVNSLVDQVQQAIADITTTVTAAIDANSYTRAEINALVASPGAIAPTTVTASGSMSTAGALTTGSDTVVGGQLRALDAVTNVITSGRYATWIETATGRFGNTSSSRRYKQDITEAQIDADVFLTIVPFVFHYIAEVRKRDDPMFEGYVGPDYVVADEYGLMAEDLHAAGLTPWVYYDAAGLPDSVNYTMLVVPLLAVARAEKAARAALEERVTRLESLMEGH